jgi:uncharacterized ubiquitin-like protein YukD
MATITVTFYNPTTSEERPQSRVSDSLTANKIIANLIDAGFMRPPDPGEHYSLQVKSGSFITGDQTLASGGVVDGDRITVVKDSEGGGLSCTILV